MSLSIIAGIISFIYASNRLIYKYFFNPQKKIPHIKVSFKK